MASVLEVSGCGKRELGEVGGTHVVSRAPSDGDGTGIHEVSEM